MKRGETGKRGEELARRFLEEKGYRIITNNYRCPEGEVDIIAQHKDCLVFIEVRSKTGKQFGSPEESVTTAKKKKLITTALRYIQAQDNPPQQWRIDFVAVEMDKKGEPLRIELIENAVSEE